MLRFCLKFTLFKKVKNYNGVQRVSTVQQTVAGKILGGRGARKPVFGVPWECENTGFEVEKSFLYEILTLKKSKNRPSAFQTSTFVEKK